MNKKSLIGKTIAGTMIIAGLSMPVVRAAVEEGAKATIDESKTTAVIQLTNSEKDALTMGDLKKLVEERYTSQGVTVSKINEVEVSEENKGTAVGTGAKVALSNGKTLTAVVMGDVNGDGMVNIDDSTEVLYHAMDVQKIEDEAKLQAADVTTAGNTAEDKVTIDDSTQLMYFYADEDTKTIIPETEVKDIVPEENIVAHSITLVDTMNNTNKIVSASEIGDYKPENFVDSEKNITYRLLGWAKNANATAEDIIDLSTTDLSKIDNLYSVWTPVSKATVRFHLDGVEDDSAEEEEETKWKVYEIPDMLAGDTVDLSSVPEPTYTSTSSGADFVFAGWQMKVKNSEGVEETIPVTDKWVIPVASNNTAQTYDVYPAWNIEAKTIGNMTDAQIKTVFTELEKLTKDDDNELCSTLTLDTDVTIEGADGLTIPEGVTVKFNKNVIVADTGKIDNTTVKRGEIVLGDGVTITKELKTATKLEDSLNNEYYNVVKLSGALTKVTDVTVKKGSKAILDLNDKAVTFDTDKKITIEHGDDTTEAGDLKIINNGKTAVTITTKTIENNGTLTIGEISNAEETEEKVLNKVKITNVKAATDSIITNGEDATLTINSGEIIGANTSAITGTKGVVTNEGTLTVNGGIINANTNARNPVLLNKGDATINGGEMIRSVNGKTDGTGYYVIVNKGGEMTIKDGTFTEASKVSGTVATLSATSALIENGFQKDTEALDSSNKIITSKLTIEGGTFRGGRYVVASDYAGDTKVVGGTFEANEKTVAETDTDKTRSIFKAVGKLEIDFTESTDAKIILGSEKSLTKVALVGDQYLTQQESIRNKFHEANLTIKGLTKDIVYKGEKKVEDKDLKDAILPEESKSDSKKAVKSEIVVYVENTDAKKAGEQLLKLLDEAVANKVEASDLKLDVNTNTVKIVLGSDVEMIAEDATPTYKTSENTVLDLNGHTLKINCLYKYNKTVDVQDSSNEKTGKILLTSTKAGVDKEIYSGGKYTLTDDELAKIADDEEKWTEE